MSDGQLVPQQFNASMARSGGNFKKAAAIFSEELEHNEALRDEAATLLIAMLLEPGRGEHERIFQLDSGMSLFDFVEKHRPEGGAG